MGTINITGTFDPGPYPSVPTLTGMQIAKLELASRAMQAILTRVDAGLIAEDDLANKCFSVAESMLKCAAAKGIYP